MTFAQVLLDPSTSLPITRTNHQPFRKQLRSSLEKFMELIEVSNNSAKAKRSNENLTNISTYDLRTLVDGICETVDFYFKGNPSDAYQKLEKTLKVSKIGEILWKDGELQSGTDLFRIRCQSGNYPLNKCDLFHIPFEERGLVRTQRYSIPGLPSLYLANSIYVAWEEMLRPAINEIQAVRLQNTRTLRFLDLTIDDYNHHELNEILDFNPKDICNKVFTWPIIAACSIKVEDPHASFKPEYIIPQLLLQWINRQNIDGIKYSSTHIQAIERKHAGNFYNLVLPVKSFDIDEGYCPVLAKLFNITQVLPMQLQQFATTSGSFLGQASISTDVNKDIYSLELVNGREEPYYRTAFGALEHALKGLNFETIFDKKPIKPVSRGIKIPRLKDLD